MEIICLETEAFHALIDQTVDRLSEKHNIPKKRWIGTEETMQELGIDSKTTLQKLRNEEAISFSRITSKNFLYDRISLEKYIEKKTQKARK